ncbi:TIR domain-containing protein [Nocardia wallacei]|uniref:TIR domain-containing protein n=1 Tax=Nocardia wallacei TaxID=480035 RepID=UPI0024566634|nr:TIR domain-containing protein [Nocardia wallacei]
MAIGLGRRRSPADNAITTQKTTYDVFLSYSHADRAIASGVQRGLHRIARKLGRLHALRVFRDATDLTASPDLWQKVTDAMDHSRYMIVVLSPHAAGSKWVNDEVTYWLERRGPDSLMYVVGSGAVKWLPLTGSFDPQTSDAALPVLTRRGVLPAEPFYVDVGPDAPWDFNAPLFREKLTDLAAPIHGKPKYELASEDLREQRRFRRFRRIGISLLLVFALTATSAAVYAIKQQREAVRQRNQAISVSLVSQARAMLAGAQSGGDVRAIQQLVASLALTGEADTGALWDAVAEKRDTVKIIESNSLGGDFAVTPDGNRILLQASDGNVRTWDARTGNSVEASSPVRIVKGKNTAYNDTATVVAIGNDNGEVSVWDMRNGSRTANPISTGQQEPSGLAVSPDGRQIATGSQDGTIRLWDVATGTRIGEPLRGHEGFVSAIAYSPDGRRLASGAGLVIGNLDRADRTVRLWDTSTGRQIGQPLVGHESWVASVAFSPDGSRLASGSDDDTVRLWDSNTGQPIGGPLTGHQDWVNDVSFSPDGRFVVSGAADRTIRVWDTSMGKQSRPPLLGHAGDVRQVRFGAGGDIVVSRGDDGTMRFWHTDIYQSVGEIVPGEPTRDKMLGFTSNGEYVVVAAPHGAIRIRDTASGATVGAEVSSENLIPSAVAVADDLSQLAVGDHGRILLFGTRTGMQLSRPVNAYQTKILSIAFSPHGKIFASSGEDGGVSLWNANSGERFGPTIEGHEVFAAGLSFSPDGRYLASSGIEGVRIWDVETGKQMGDLMELTIGTSSVAFSADGARLASGGLDGTVRIWDRATTKPISELMTGHQDEVWAVAFSPDGKYLVTGGADGTIRLWNGRTGTAVGSPMPGHHSEVHKIAFSADGKRIVSASSDGGVLIWPGPEELVAELCAKLTAGISEENWKKWVSPDVEYDPSC